VLRIAHRCGPWMAGCLGALVACSSAATTQPSASGGSLNLDPPPPALCPDASTGAMTPSTCVPGPHRDFTTEIVPLFSGCSGEICHSFAGGGIATQIGAPATECCNRIAIIESGHPESSYLLNKLSGRGLCDGAQMPLGRAAFSASDLQLLSEWICQGADTNP